MTGQRQVRLVATPVMLLRHDVLDVQGDDIVLLMDATILAAVSCTVAHVTSSWHPSTTHVAAR